MSRYFFHVQDGTTYPDTEGTELPNLQAARRHAARYAGQLLQDAPDTFWSGAQWQMTVTDARGLTLFCLIFAGIDAPALG